MSLIERIKAEAKEIGFVACGVANLSPSQWGNELQRWLDRGYGGTMRYLHRQAARRRDPAQIVPDACCAVVVLENYFPRAPVRPGVRIARYAQGADYHVVMRDRLDRLSALLRAEGASVARPYVDAGPVPERELGARAGLGWIGKNTMLIRPTTGSYFFIGAIFTDLDLPIDSPLATDHCGTCTRCLDACPTQAFVAPRILDATRCISYQTIEQKGPIPEDVVEAMAGWAFGCDICNEVCPWNERFATPTDVGAYEPDGQGPLNTEDPTLFDQIEKVEFVEQYGGTPLARPGLQGMRRNWAAAWRSLEPHGPNPETAKADSPER